MNRLKKFKVFYFLGGDHQGIDETRRKCELIMARSEDEAEKLFRLVHSKDLSNYKIFFGWVEEVAPSVRRSVLSM
jgi:hypothetical protein